MFKNVTIVDSLPGGVIKLRCDLLVKWLNDLCKAGVKAASLLDIWKSASMSPLCKGKRNKSECTNYTGFNLLNMLGKVLAEF